MQKIEQLESDGFIILRKILDDKTISHLLEELSLINKVASIISKRKDVYGVRDLLNLSPKIKAFAESSLVESISKKYLGEKAKLVRAIYFDKTSNANWKVPWHQDLTIAVKERIDTSKFSAWTRKAEIDHVQPPIEILERMLTLRFHLDKSAETNGALKVLTGSHKFGRLSATEIQKIKSNQLVHLCKTEKGDCLLMKPLLLHASSAGSDPKHRRVIHFEFSADDLPNGLTWYGS